MNPSVSRANFAGDTFCRHFFISSEIRNDLNSSKRSDYVEKKEKEKNEARTCWGRKRRNFPEALGEVFFQGKLCLATKNASYNFQRGNLINICKDLCKDAMEYDG